MRFILSEEFVKRRVNTVILFELFLTFLQIGAVSFGGGYAMIAMIREKVLLYGWLTEEELMNMIAVSESTPGPIAVNMATFVGSAKGGIPGAFFATLGVVLPSFVIILLIASLIRGFLKYKSVKAVLGTIRPCVVGMLLATAATMFMSVLLRFRTVGDPISPDVRGLIIFILLLFISFSYKKLRKKKPSPILMILISAGLGMLLYAV